jgi:hypothetical protein
VAEIVAELGTRYRTVPDVEVRRFLTGMVARRCVDLLDSEPIGRGPIDGELVDG